MNNTCNKKKARQRSVEDTWFTIRTLAESYGYGSPLFNKMLNEYLNKKEKRTMKIK